jgi:hypothetical protein
MGWGSMCGRRSVAGMGSSSSESVRYTS